MCVCEFESVSAHGPVFARMRVKGKKKRFALKHFIIFLKQFFLAHVRKCNNITFHPCLRDSSFSSLIQVAFFVTCSF